VKNRKNIIIDMGGTRLKIGFFDGLRLMETKIISACSQEAFVHTIHKMDAEITNFCRSFHLKTIDGIGLSIPGIVDTSANRVISINEKYSDSITFDLNQWSSNTWNTILITENDARAALMGEWKAGAGKGIDNLVMLTLGTGIGGSTLIEGKLLHGKHFQAGCLGGHFCIDFQGVPCNCGNKGCAETRGSSWALPSLAKEAGWQNDVIDFEQLFNAMRADTPEAAFIVKTCIEAWSACAVNLIHAYDPERIIVGGGVMKSADIILPAMENLINRYAWTPWGKVDLKAAELGDTAALYGMNYLLHEKTVA
jgi:glucokinase